MNEAKQHWDADIYCRHADFVPALGRPVLDLLGPRAGERILDLGCGDGTLSVEIAAAGVTVVGVDSAPSMVERARSRGIDAHVADGQRLGFESEFDAVFSNAALHWMRDADAVLAGVARALKPGGRFVGEFGGHGNVAAVKVALSAVLQRRGIDPRAHLVWYFPTAEAYRERLEAHGFAVSTTELIPRPTPLPTDMSGWLDTFAGPLLSALPEAERAAARDEAVALLALALRDDRSRWTADYVRLRFAARLSRDERGAAPAD